MNAIPNTFVAKSGRREFWVVEIDGQYAVGVVKGSKVAVDGCERFADPVDAKILAAERAAV